MEICICLWQPVSTVICMYFLLRTILATNSPENKKTKKKHQCCYIKIG